MKLRIDPLTVAGALLASYWVFKDVVDEFLGFVDPPIEMCNTMVLKEPETWKYVPCADIDGIPTPIIPAKK